MVENNMSRLFADNSLQLDFVFISDILQITSVYFVGNPKVFPIHFEIVEVDSMTSFNFSRFIWSIFNPFCGGGTYCVPVLRFLCLYSFVDYQN